MSPCPNRQIGRVLANSSLKPSDMASVMASDMASDMATWPSTWRHGHMASFDTVFDSIRRLWIARRHDWISDLRAKIQPDSKLADYPDHFLTDLWTVAQAPCNRNETYTYIHERMGLQPSLYQMAWICIPKLLTLRFGEDLLCSAPILEKMQSLVMLQEMDLSRYAHTHCAGCDGILECCKIP